MHRKIDFILTKSILVNVMTPDICLPHYRVYSNNSNLTKPLVEL
jgi:hypothetical protein